MEDERADVGNYATPMTEHQTNLVYWDDNGILVLT